jgi:hypothetical protein
MSAIVQTTSATDCRGESAGRTGQLGGPPRRLRVVLDRGAQLFHGGGGFLQAGDRFLGALAQVPVACGDFRTGHADAPDLLAHVVDQRTQVQARLVDGPRQHAQAIDAVHLQTLGHLAGGHHHGLFSDLAQR